MAAAPRFDVEGRDWPHRAQSRFVEAGGLHWHVQSFGAEDAPVALLLHGTGAATHSWRGLAPLLAARFRVIAPDLPGHGFTSGRLREGATMPAMARAVAALLGALDVRPALLVGHSAGAAIAARMVLDGLAAPQAIIGLGAALMPFPGLGAALFPSLARLLFVNPFAPHLFAGIAQMPGEVGRFLERSTGSRIDAVGVACYRRLFASPAHCAGALAMMAEWDLAALKRDLPRLAPPLLLLHGARDAAIPSSGAREAAALIRDARIEMLAGLGHLAHEEQPETVAARILDFAETEGASWAAATSH